MQDKNPIRVLCHGKPTLRIGARFGWLPGARYTNLRDVRGFERVGMIDIEWKDYNYKKHLCAVKQVRPLLTIARDVEHEKYLAKTIDQASELALWSSKVVIVPKDPRLSDGLTERIPPRFLLGYSVPTRYGSTSIEPACFGKRPVHLLGGRPDAQFKLAALLNVFSLDGNRFTLDAAYGDYFDGVCFVPHPEGGYYECIRSSLREINRLWSHSARSKNENRLRERAGFKQNKGAGRS
jgi:hypothetical protein